jgi:hypothetical protein
MAKQHYGNGVCPHQLKRPSAPAPRPSARP